MKIDVKTINHQICVNACKPRPQVHFAAEGVKNARKFKIWQNFKFGTLVGTLVTPETIAGALKSYL